MTPLSYIVYPLAVCCIAGTLISFISVFGKATLVSMSVDQPVLALGLAKNPGEMAAILGWRGAGPGDANYLTMKWVQYLDFFFIAGYTSFFSLVALSFNRSVHLLVVLLSWSSLVSIVATAIFDILENAAILTALKGRDTIPAVGPLGVLRVWPIRRFAILKWACLFLSVLALAGTLLSDSTKRSPVVVGALTSLILSSTVGLAATATSRDRAIASSFRSIMLAFALLLFYLGLPFLTPVWLDIKQTIDAVRNCSSVFLLDRGVLDPERRTVCGFYFDTGLPRVRARLMAWNRGEQRRTTNGMSLHHSRTEA